jgi:hypothetical protein
MELSPDGQTFTIGAILASRSSGRAKSCTALLMRRPALRVPITWDEALDRVAEQFIPLKKPLIVFLLLVFLPLAASAVRYLCLGDGRGNWQTADRSSAGLLSPRCWLV